MRTIFYLSALVMLGSSAAAGEHEPHWGYSGAGGPSHWGSLNHDYAACQAGKLQSPIDIRTDKVHRSKLPALAFHYQPVPLRIIDNGHTIQIIYAPGSTISAVDQRYGLVQIHFHRPSEEQINGKPFEMVAHLVHRDHEGHLAVVAVPLRVGPENRFVSTAWHHLPKTKGEEVTVPGVTINAGDLLPASRDYYAYTGSLTTPPCSEGVRWFVLKNPATVSRAEIEQFAKIYPSNARPVQPLNGREVVTSQ
jgi:carbonic anhydrase